MTDHESARRSRHRIAWRRYRRLMAVALMAAIVIVAAGIAWLVATGSPTPWMFLLAVAAGAGGTVLLTAALMGLVFLSNSSGIDDEAGRDDRGAPD